MGEVKIPNHVGIIVDGNGRWALKRGLSRSKGHEAGFKNIQKLTSYIYKKGVKYISAYLFSTENFKRSKEEVGYIMNTLLVGSLKEILAFCKKEKIKAIISGRKENLSDKVMTAIKKIEDETSMYKDKVFNICFNYGARAEIVDACKRIIKEADDGLIDVAGLSEEEFSKYLYQDIPDIDLLIRTSGEMRLSNFMLWQNAYAEFYFPDTLFPDFKEADFDKALEVYTKRDRRFGGVDYENKSN